VWGYRYYPFTWAVRIAQQTKQQVAFLAGSTPAAERVPRGRLQSAAFACDFRGWLAAPQVIL
jgi:hypothetical protein